MSDRGTTWSLLLGLCMAGACASSPGPKPQLAVAPAAGPPASEAPTPAVPGPFARCQVNGCTFDFTVDLTPGGRDALVVVDRCIDPVPNCEANVGRLTPVGRTTAATVRDSLSQASVDEAYGCAGCVDGPIYTFALPAAGGTATQHRYDPLHDAYVPELLRPAHALLQSAEHAAALCKSNENVELTAPCSPRR